MGQAGALRGGRRALLGGDLRRRVPGAQLHPEGGGHRRPSGRQGPRHHPAGVSLHPAALQHHHRALDQLPGQGPRPAGGGAGGPAPAVPRQAERDGGALVLDGGAAGGADLHGVRDRLLGRPAVSARRLRGVRPVPAAAGRGGDDLHHGAGERLSGAAYPRAARPDRARRAGARGDRAALHAPRAAGPARGLPQLRGLSRRASHADQPVAAQRMGGGHGHELAPPGGGPLAGRDALGRGARRRGHRCRWCIAGSTIGAFPRPRRAPRGRCAGRCEGRWAPRSRACPRPSGSSSSRTCGSSSATTPSGASSSCSRCCC